MELALGNFSELDSHEMQNIDGGGAFVAAFLITLAVLAVAGLGACSGYQDRRHELQNR